MTDFSLHSFVFPENPEKLENMHRTILTTVSSVSCGIWGGFECVASMAWTDSGFELMSTPKEELALSKFQTDKCKKKVVKQGNQSSVEQKMFN